MGCDRQGRGRRVLMTLGASLLMGWVLGWLMRGWMKEWHVIEQAREYMRDHYREEIDWFEQELHKANELFSFHSSVGNNGIADILSKHLAKIKTKIDSLKQKMKEI